MRTNLRRLALLWPLVAALAACSPRAPAPPPPAPAPSAPPEAPAPAAPAASAPSADRERDAVLFTHWRATHVAEVDAFEEFLVREHVAAVVPTYQLLRSASMWKECRAEPFQLPPAVEWPAVRDLLVLLRELRKRGVLLDFEVVSAYRDPRLNKCAGGAPGSSHQRFAVDIAPLPEPEGARLCRFWREEGKAWDMGVSRYPSGRIHIDRTGYRTWGASHRRASSYCLE
ncbi:peptidase M15 [Ramlibacter sp. USB13]|uniref:Peptidase M15 n=1 Tax=Ramlibacter cellulosilyticus TaxID=2764187 RepID=A0A923MQM3_9BURK|nr:D-Ala-D-Ala carboxypeptidase family metallohydrolase [Ramlibacter cellulosilyticus]MBC5784022.1 peptidase M15 [Ramlibacter cellulosilyticus]